MKKLVILFLLPFLLVACSTQSEPEIETDGPLVVIEMEDGGKIYIELFPEIAPNTVRNFIDLIEDGFYDGLLFHRVIPGFMVQGGCPQGTGMGNPGYAIKGEFTANGFENNLKHTRGVLSMARGGHSFDSAGSQFFIMVDDSPHLDGQYASFGKVVHGMDVVDGIVSVERSAQDRPLRDQRIKRVTVDTFGQDYGRVEKLGR